MKKFLQKIKDLFNKLFKKVTDEVHAPVVLPPTPEVPKPERPVGGTENANTGEETLYAAALRRGVDQNLIPSLLMFSGYQEVGLTNDQIIDRFLNPEPQKPWKDELGSGFTGEIDERYLQDEDKLGLQALYLRGGWPSVWMDCVRGSRIAVNSIINDVGVNRLKEVYEFRLSDWRTPYAQVIRDIAARKGKAPF